MGYYEGKEPTYKVNVLGGEYDVFMGVFPDDDKMLDGCDGYCDWTVKRIVVIGRVPQEQHENFEERQKVCLRHELIHAFLYESGIDQNTNWDIDGQIHPEQMVQWIARQFPKIQKAFEETGAL